MRRVLLALFLLVAGCGGDDDGAAGSGDESPEAAENGSDTAATPAKAAPTAEELRSALLAVEDLPEGFAVSPPEEEDEDSGDEYCDDRDPTKAVPAAVESEVSFQKESFGPFVGESISHFSSGDEAERFMDEVRAVLTECASYEQAESGGQTSKVTVTKLSFDKQGDDTVAMKINAAGSFPFAGELVAVRHDDVVVFVSHAGLGVGVDFELTKSLVAKALDKAKPLL